MSNNKLCILADKFQRVTSKNSIGNTNVLTISAQHGLINQFEYYNHQYASENTSGYTLLKKGDFAYNKSYSDGYPWGATKRLERYDAGIVSPLYICFSAKDGVCADFYSYYFESESFYREIYKIAQEGARNHGLLNVSTEDFFKIQIANPPLEEQRRIAEILGCCDRVIALKKELIAEKKKQKKSLMQKLLNPDSGFRLPGFSGEWKKRQLKQVTEYVDYRGKTPIKTNWGVPLITARNIKNGKIDFHESQEFISEKDYNHVMRRGQPQLGDVLITTEAPLGSVAQIIDPHVALAQRIIKYRGVNNILNNNFLAYYLASDNFQLELLSLATGCTAKGIKGATLHELEICYPAIAEQQAIADILSAADKEIDLLEQELVQQEQKKKSLMQLLLTGIVRV